MDGYCFNKILKTDGKMLTDLSGLLYVIHVHIHFRYKKGRPRAITCFSKSKYVFKKSKGKTRFNT